MARKVVADPAPEAETETESRKILTTLNVEQFREYTRFGKERSYLIEGHDLNSVTSIIDKGEPKPALINWAKGVTADYAIHHADTIKSLVDGGDSEGAKRLLVGAGYAVSDAAKKLGSAVHEVAEAIALGASMDIPDDPQVISFVQQLENFLDVAQPEHIAAELMVFDVGHGYAGTLDGIARFPGLAEFMEPRFGDAPVMFDYKSGKGVYGSAAAQMAAYAHAAHYIGPDGEIGEVADLDVAGGVVVHITPDGWSVVEVDISERTFGYFVAMGEMADWAKSGNSAVDYRKPVATGTTHKAPEIEVPVRARKPGKLKVKGKAKVAK